MCGRVVVVAVALVAASSSRRDPLGALVLALVVCSFLEGVTSW